MVDIGEISIYEPQLHDQYTPALIEHELPGVLARKLYSGAWTWKLEWIVVLTNYCMSMQDVHVKAEA